MPVCRLWRAFHSMVWWPLRWQCLCAQTDLRCLMLRSWLPAMTAAAIFSAFSGALVSCSGLSGRPNGRLLFPLADLMEESRPNGYHQIFLIVCVVIAAKPKWIIDQHSCSYILHNCPIGSVNCIPIGHVLGQQNERLTEFSPMTSAYRNIAAQSCTYYCRGHQRYMSGMTHKTMEA